MKLKTILLSVFVVCMIFLIYIMNLDRKTYILSLEIDNDSTYIKEYINNKNKLEIYVDGFIDEKDRITDLINYINHNKKIEIGNKTFFLQNCLIKADIIIIKIGKQDLIDVNSFNDIDEYLEDLTKLLQLVKKYSKEKIIYINNSIDNNFKEYTIDKIKRICSKNNIEYKDNNYIFKKEEIMQFIR